MMRLIEEIDCYAFHNNIIITRNNKNLSQLQWNRRKIHSNRSSMKLKNLNEFLSNNDKVLLRLHRRKWHIFTFLNYLLDS